MSPDANRLYGTLWCERCADVVIQRCELAECPVPLSEWEQMKAELSRMRTALEEIRDKRRDPRKNVNDHVAGLTYAYNQCAAIAERALTAGSGE